MSVCVLIGKRTPIARSRNIPQKASSERFAAMLAALACLGAIDSVHSSLVHETHQDRSDLLRTPGKRHRVIVTGGAGYVGSHTVHALARAGVYDLLVIDNLESGHAEAVPRGVALKVLALDDACFTESS